MKVTRREFICALAALAATDACAATRLRLAICNETFAPLSFAEACRVAKQAGFEGLEIAPFTLGDDPVATAQARRAELRDVMKSSGMEYVGLHALLAAPKGLHVTAPDEAVRRKSWDYVRRLVDLAADLGSPSVMVFGSGKQRSAGAGVAIADAVKRFSDGLAEIAPAAEARRVTILIESLAPHLSNVVNTLDEAVALARQINSPAVSVMFDTHNAVAEKLPHGELIKMHHQRIRHVHLNEMDGRHPGAGDYDFAAVLRALMEVSYRGWVSVEVFDFAPGGERIARDSARFIRQLEAKLKY